MNVSSPYQSEDTGKLPPPSKFAKGFYETTEIIHYLRITPKSDPLWRELFDAFVEEILSRKKP
jgi:hypothetical protein